MDDKGEKWSIKGLADEGMKNSSSESAEKRPAVPVCAGAVERSVAGGTLLAGVCVEHCCGVFAGSFAKFVHRRRRKSFCVTPLDAHPSELSKPSQLANYCSPALCFSSTLHLIIHCATNPISGCLKIARTRLERKVDGLVNGIRESWH